MKPCSNWIYLAVHGCPLDARLLQTVGKGVTGLQCVNVQLDEMLLHTVRPQCVRKCIPQCSALKRPYPV